MQKSNATRFWLSKNRLVEIGQNTRQISSHSDQLNWQSLRALQTLLIDVYGADKSF